jgi:hypothetical protein
VDAAVFGVAAVAAVAAAAAAVAAGEVAVVVAAAAVAAACHGAVAPSAKRHTTFQNSMDKKSPSQHCGTGRGVEELPGPWRASVAYYAAPGASPSARRLSDCQTAMHIPSGFPIPRYPRLSVFTLGLRICLT